jgi:hypothetical protein
MNTSPRPVIPSRIFLESFQHEKGIVSLPGCSRPCESEVVLLMAQRPAGPVRTSWEEYPPRDSLTNLTNCTRSLT